MDARILAAETGHARAFRIYLVPVAALYLDPYRCPGVELAGRVHRRERAQSHRRRDRRVPLSDHRAGAAPDPQCAAQPGRHRHLPGDRDPDHHFHPGGRASEPAETVPVTEGADRPFAVAPDGIVLAVRLTPKGGRDAIDGIATLSDGNTVLKVRVRAAPFEGEANAALGRVLAKALGA